MAFSVLDLILLQKVYAERVFVVFPGLFRVAHIVPWQVSFPPSYLLTQDLSRKVLRVRCPHAVEISRITNCVYFQNSSCWRYACEEGASNRVLRVSDFSEKFCGKVLFWVMLRCTLAVSIYQTTRCHNPGDQITRVFTSAKTLKFNNF